MDKLEYIPGDLVMLKGIANKLTNECAIVKVTEANIDESVVVSKFRGSDLCQRVKVDDIIPIPILSEILKNNGWTLQKYSNTGYYFKDCKPQLKLYGNDGYFEVTYGKEDLAMHINYLHQLQHLLFGLGLDSSLKV